MGIPQLKLNPVCQDDAATLFQWRNDPSIIARGSSQRGVTWEEHSKWFNETVQKINRIMYLILLEDMPIGQVRFDFELNASATVSIFLLSPYTGKGLGVAALQKACLEIFAQCPIEQVHAFIRSENTQSINAFKKAGFVLSDHCDLEAPPAHVILSLERPSLVPHNRLTYDQQEAMAITEVVLSGHWAGGSKVTELEACLASEANVKHAICTSSGLGALRLTLLGLGIQRGDKVLVPAYSCVALANAVLACGAEPIPVDVIPDNWNLDVQEVERAVRLFAPQAIIAINIFGLPSAIEDMLEWGIPVIEDCAHAFGLQHGNKRLGGRAHAGVLSFHATKLIGAGAGGAILTNSEELAQFARSWRDYSDQSSDATRLNDTMTDLAAALACCQLRRLPHLIKARRLLADRYDSLLSMDEDYQRVFELSVPCDNRVWYRYALRLYKETAQAAITCLSRFGVQAAEPVNRWIPQEIRHCPNANLAYNHVISLPLYPTLTESEQDRVIHAFLSFCKESRSVSYEN